MTNDIERALIMALVEVPPRLLTPEMVSPRFFDPAELDVEDMGGYDLTAERCRLVEAYEEAIQESGGQESDKTRFIRKRLDAVLDRLKNIISDIFTKGGLS